METKDTLKQIALDTFDIDDVFRLKFPWIGEKIQEAMEISFKAGEKKVVKWLENHSHILDSYHTEEWQAFLKSEGIE